MKKYVIDASVIIKWVFPERKDENHLSQAMHLLKAIKQDMLDVFQPPHWLAEVGAVVVRLQPKIAQKTIHLLDAMDFNIVNMPEIYSIACDLSERFEHHLFDTLYHAVALHTGDTTFITADDKYYRKAFKHGAIIRLENFSLFDD